MVKPRHSSFGSALYRLGEKLPLTVCPKPRNQCPWLTLRMLRTMVCILNQRELSEASGSHWQMLRIS